MTPNSESDGLRAVGEKRKVPVDCKGGGCEVLRKWKRKLKQSVESSSPSVARNEAKCVKVSSDSEAATVSGADGERATLGMGRERKEHKACVNCGTQSTPFWRKDRSGSGQHLCNACGLYLAKNDAPRPAVLWKSV